MCFLMRGHSYNLSDLLLPIMSQLNYHHISSPNLILIITHNHYHMLQTQYYPYLNNLINSFVFCIMSHHKNQFDEESELSSQIQYHHFKEKIKIPENHIHELVYREQKFHQTLQELIGYGLSKIKIQEFMYGLAYLAEAEKILEYGASCGKIIDRQLIITILHNEALCYQKLNQHEKASKYVQAIIFNLTAHIKTLSNTPMNSKIDQHTTSIKSIQSANSLYTRKLQLAQYYLVFCSLNSQTSRRKQSLEAAKKGIKIYKQYFKELKKRLIGKMDELLCFGEDKTKVMAVLKSLSIFRKEQELELENIEKLIKNAKGIVRKWVATVRGGKVSETVLDKMMSQYSIANLVELGVEHYHKQGKDIGNIFFQGKKILKNIANYSMGYFQIATQYRLISQLKYQAYNIQITSPEYKYSKIYYLLSIIYIGLHIPYNFLFMNQMITSFEYHYQIDLKKGQEVSPQKLQLKYLFETEVAASSKSRKKSIVSKKSKESKKNKGKYKSSMFTIKQEDNPTVEDQYLIREIPQRKIRKRTISSASQKSRKDFKDIRQSKQQDIIRQQIHPGRRKRIQTTGRIEKQIQEPIPHIKTQEEEYLKLTGSQRFETQQTKKVNRRCNRVISSDNFTDLHKFSKSTVKKQEQPQPKPFYQPFPKSPKHKNQKTPTLKKHKKSQLDFKSKESKKSFGTSLQKQYKKNKKKNMNPKQKARKQTMANYCL